MKKKIILLFCFLNVLTNVHALSDVKNEKVSICGPHMWYEDSFLDNTFAGVSLGGGMRISAYDISRNGLKGQSSFVYSAHIGKWFNPGLGAQVNFRKGKVEHFDANYNLLTVDFLFDLPNWIYGVDAGRKFYCAPFVGTGCGFAGKGTQGITFTFGVQERMKVCDRMELFAELRGDIYGNKLLSQNVNTMNLQMALQVGVSYLFREKSFRKADLNDDNDGIMELNDRINMLMEKIRQLEAFDKSVMGNVSDDTTEVVTYKVPKKQSNSSIYVKFSKFSYYLQDSERQIVNKVGRWLSESGDRKIKIVPFTDSVTESEYSRQLSKKRIDEILSILCKYKGVDKSRVLVLSPEELGYKDKTDSSVMIIFDN